MRWKSINNKKIYTTADGYYLEVAPEEQLNKYIWALFKNGILINSSKIENIFCKDYRVAKKMVLQRMIKDILKTKK